MGTDAAGSVIQTAKFRCETALIFFERADRAVVGVEACPGSQWFARKLQAMGHTVRIIPAQFVKPLRRIEQERHDRRGGRDRRSGDPTDNALR